MFESLILSTAEGFAESSTGLITAIGILIGAAAPLVIAIAGYMKAGKAKDIATTAGQGMTLFGQKTNEYADRIKNILQAGYNLSPEQAKEAANSVVDDIDKLTTQIQVGTQQFNVIRDNLPLEARADSNQSLPREGFNTKPLTTVSRASTNNADAL